jgi:hypothetical protein
MAGSTDRNSTCRANKKSLISSFKLLSLWDSLHVGIEIPHIDITLGNTVKHILGIIICQFLPPGGSMGLGYVFILLCGENSQLMPLTQQHLMLDNK